MSTSAPMSPLARVVLTRIRRTSIRWRSWRLRLLVAFVGVGVIAGTAWAMRRGGERPAATLAAPAMQVRPALKLNPATRIDRAADVTAPANPTHSPPSNR
jgi:hypothetical protein